jgi:hypothetical protein
MLESQAKGQVNPEAPWTAIEDDKADDKDNDDEADATYHMPQTNDWDDPPDGDYPDGDKQTAEEAGDGKPLAYLSRLQVKASGRAEIETKRVFDMRQVWWKCFNSLIRALGETKGTVFGGAALYWFQVDVLRKRMHKWLNAQWQSVQQHDEQTCLFLNPTVNPTNATRRLTLRRPTDVDVWFHSSLHLDEAMILLRGALRGNVRITPVSLAGGGEDDAEMEGTIYSSSPFAKALIRHRRFLVTFDVFPLPDMAPLPSRLTEPLKFILDCTYPVVALPLDLSWPWQLTPYPTKVKCLGLYRGQKVGADTTLAPWRLLESRADQMLLWQPLADAMSQAYLWDLCDRIGAFKDFYFDDYELLCRQCVVAYVRRLFKELSSDTDEETKDEVEAEDDDEATYATNAKEEAKEGEEAVTETATKTDKDKAEFTGSVFTLSRTKKSVSVTRNDTKESQSWPQFRYALYHWQRSVTIRPSVVSLEGGRRYMQWRCPWRLDMDATIPCALGEPLTLC